MLRSGRSELLCAGGAELLCSGCPDLLCSFGSGCSGLLCPGRSDLLRSGFGLCHGWLPDRCLPAGRSGSRCSGPGSGSRSRRCPGPGSRRLIVSGRLFSPEIPSRAST